MHSKTTNSFFEPSNFKRQKSNSFNEIKFIQNDITVKSSPREMLQDFWKKECGKKKRSLLHFIMNSLAFKDSEVDLAHFNNYFKAPLRKFDHWPKDHEIVELHEKLLGRFSI